MQVSNRYLPAIIHSYAMDRLYVTRVQGIFLIENAASNLRARTLEPNSYYYVECSKFGVVDWKNTKVHEIPDLVSRDNVFVVEPSIT